MTDQEQLDETKSLLLVFIQSNRVMSWHSANAWVELARPDLTLFVERALSELTQSNTIKRYEYTKDNNRRETFYLSYEYRIII